MKIIFLGPQGSGKSTQAKMLSKSLKLPYIEMSQLLRAKMGSANNDAKAITKAMDQGTLVPDNIVIRSLHQRLENPDCTMGYILDGFPRSREQLVGLPGGVSKVFYITISDEEALTRLLKRGRIDDSEQIIKKRLNVYHDLTEPVLKYFREKGLLKEINGERTIEKINKGIESIIKDDKK